MNHDDERDHAEEADQLADMRREQREERAAELTQLLITGARHRGYTNEQAAVYLLTFPELFENLADHAPFRDRLKYGMVKLLGTTDLVQAAWVPDYRKLLDFADELGLGDTSYNMLQLVASLASGANVCLRDVLHSMNAAYATRVVEAVAIALSLTERHDVTVLRHVMSDNGRVIHTSDIVTVSGGPKWFRVIEVNHADAMVRVWPVAPVNLQDVGTWVPGDALTVIDVVEITAAEREAWWNQADTLTEAARPGFRDGIAFLKHGAPELAIGRFTRARVAQSAANMSTDLIDEILARVLAPDLTHASGCTRQVAYDPLGTSTSCGEPVKPGHHWCTKHTEGE